MNNLQNHISPQTTTSFLTTAHNIGKKLAKDAIWSPEGFCNWQGGSLEVTKGQYQIVQRTFKADIYNGLSGILLFLSELYVRTNDSIIYQLVDGSVKNILHQHEKEPLPSKFSFFGGQLGLGFTLWRVGMTLNNPEWKAKGLEILNALSDQRPNEEEVDLIAGAAGAIPVLLGVYNFEQTTNLVETAKNCGNFLLEKAQKEGTSWSWESIGAKNGLTGYSHGAAGIANAFLDLYKVTNEAKYLAAANGGYQFERKHYNAQQRNWPDLRAQEQATPNSPAVCGEMWCHGAPGIALSRIKAYQQTGDASLFEEAQIALDTTYRSVYKTLQNVSLGNFSLCHGLAGNADILLAAGHTLSNQMYIQLAEQVGQLGVELYDKTGTDWPSGINDPSGLSSGRHYTPGLMLGVSGTGYFYLRLADKNLPSMLLL